MSIDYDKEADAAYIHLFPLGNKGFEVAKTHPCDPQEVDGMINLDFDKEGRLIGIEILDASKKIHKDLLG